MKTKNIVVLILIVLPCFSAVAQTVGTFTDERDNKTYRTVRIGNITWMAENLNFHTDNSWCYDNADSNCLRYGRLYTLDAAKTACPAGWRLPTEDDWDNLSQAASGRLVEKKGGDGYADDYVWDRHWDVAGGKLKSKTDWVGMYGKPNGNGTDEIGFSALPGGKRSFNPNNPDRDYFKDIGEHGRWWSAPDSGGNRAYIRGIYSHLDEVNWLEYDRRHGISVRCVRN
ncbi:MAG: fibrobacter succinogenes major paralogous domain-containing protein [Chitinispirillales bacterium]|nr:fibrobacter succinogenes major paralogous domain-containing protein [Chitinispirillales bacterium]